MPVSRAYPNRTGPDLSDARLSSADVSKRLTPPSPQLMDGLSPDQLTQSSRWLHLHGTPKVPQGHGCSSLSNIRLELLEFLESLLIRLGLQISAGEQREL